MAHHSTVRGTRGNLDRVEYKLTRLELLQARLDIANTLIQLKDLPTIVQRGKQLRDEVQAEVMKIVKEA